MDSVVPDYYRKQLSDLEGKLTSVASSQDLSFSFKRCISDSIEL